MHTRRSRVELAALFALALAVRVTYVLGWKHPYHIGGDAYWYHYGANLLVSGHGFIDAWRYRSGIVAQTADHPPMTILVLAAASLVGLKSVLAHQLELCLMGSGTVVVIALVARQLAGRWAGVAAGAIAAIYPNLWFNDALVMSETVVQFTTALAVLAAYRWWAEPTRRRAAVLGLAIGATALTRAEAILFVPLVAGPLILLDRRHAWAERLRHAAVAVTVTVAVVAPWVAFNLARFDEPVFISSGFDPTFAVSNCAPVYYGRLLGYWDQRCIIDVPAPTHGDVPAQEIYYRKLAVTYFDAHRSRVPVVVVARVGRALGLFRPVQQIKLDRIEDRELRPSELGLAMYYALAAGTVGGVWALRRRRAPVSPILATVATVVVATAITFGETRYRASAEPVLVIGAAVGLASLVRRRRERDPVVLDVAAHAQDSTAAPVPVPAGRFPCFDGLRAIAAVTVLLVHTSFPSGFTTRNQFWGAFTARLEIGVAVFFLISGFLLYRPFVRAHLAGRPGPAVALYLRRRMLRIVPAYWVALFFAAYVLHVVPHIHGVKGAVVYFGFLQIYSRSYILHGISAAWTLCVEVSFYLFLPLYAALIARLGGRVRTQVAGVAALFGISLVWKAALVTRPTVQQTGAMTWLPAQLDLFALGMALAVASVWWTEHHPEPAVLVSRHLPAWSWSAALVCLVVVSHVGLPRVPVYTETFGQLIVRQWLYAGFAVFLLLPAVFGPQADGWIRRLLQSKPLVATGLVSYGVYLWHEAWITEMLTWSHRPLFTVGFVHLTAGAGILTAVSAGVSYVLVEQPAQRLGRRRPRVAVPVLEPAVG